MDSDSESSLGSRFLIQTPFAASSGLLWPAGFESRFGFKKKWCLFQLESPSNWERVDSDSAGFGVPGFGFGFEMPVFAHH